MNYSIFVLSFNHPDLTERCVTSCLNFSTNVTLVHNGSNLENVSRLKLKFPQIRHVEIIQNKGFTGGANAAVKDFIENQKSAWMLFITNDCELLRIDSLPCSNGLYGPLIFKRKTEYVDSLGGGINLKNLTLFHVKEKFKTPKNYYVPGTAWLMDRQSLIIAPQFREQLGTYWEDVLFSFECNKKGIFLGQHDGITLRHGIGKTCHKDPHYTSYLYRRNRWIVLDKILNLTAKQKLILTFQDFNFFARLLLKGQFKKLSLAVKAFNDRRTSIESLQTF